MQGKRKGSEAGGGRGRKMRKLRVDMWIKRGQRRLGKKIKFWPSMTLGSYLRTNYTILTQWERQKRERESAALTQAHLWKKSASPRGVYAAKCINFQTFFLSSTACKKASAACPLFTLTLFSFIPCVEGFGLFLSNQRLKDSYWFCLQSFQRAV